MKKNLSFAIIISMIMLLNLKAKAQSTRAANTPLAGTDHLGWDASSSPFVTSLDIATKDVGANAIPINFYTNNTLFLQVLTTGDLNIYAPSNAYEINGNPVLWHNNNTSDIFVGVSAGNNFMSGHYNTFVGNSSGSLNNAGVYNSFIGNQAGKNNSSSGYNTFVGGESGENNTTAEFNTFCGYGSGISTTTGEANSFFGEHSGFNNTTGTKNTYLGIHAGYGDVGGTPTPIQNTFVGTLSGEHIKTGADNVFTGYVSGANCQDGDQNTALGSNAGRYITTGSRNVYVGYQAGFFNYTGNDNTYVGKRAGPSAALQLNNSVAIGADAYVKHDDQMILGNNNVNVGIGLSGDATGPQSKLEISTGVAGTSGLQFKELSSGSTPSIWNGFDLSVDINGKVILVPDAGVTDADNGLHIDGATGKVFLGGQLIQPNTDIDMNGDQLTLDGVVSNTTGTVGIGTSATTIAKLNVAGSSALAAGGNEIAASFEAVEASPQPTNSFGNKITVNGAKERNVGSDIDIDCATGSSGNAGIWAYVHGSSDDFKPNFGGYFSNEIVASGSTSREVNYGVRGNAFNEVGYSYGTYGNAYHNTIYGTCIGASGIGDGGRITYGVYGEAKNCGASCWAGYFNGAVYSTTGYTISDASLKSNIEPIIDPMSIINQLQPKSYTFNQEQNETMHLPDGTHFGMLAQDIEAVLPQLVKQGIQPEVDDSLGNVIHPEINFKAVNYTEFIPFLVAAVKQMDSTNQALQNQLNDLRSIVEGCCNHTGERHSNENTDASERRISVELGSSNSIVLNQNDPNPFAEETHISYVIPGDVQKAEIIFYDNNGKVLKTVVINERGKGNMQVYASNLSSGIYTYSLIADGKLIDTKHMVCNK